MTRFTRISRPFAALALAAAMVAAGPGNGQAAEMTKLKVSILPIVDTAPLFAAKKQGYFAAEGLEIDTARVVSGTAGIPGAVAGVYDIVYTNIVSTLLAKSQGLDIRIIASGSQAGTKPPDTAGLIGRKADHIKSGADLEGKTIAVNQRNNINWLFAVAWIKKTGGDVSKVKIREVPFPQMVDAVKSKQVDVAHDIEPFLSGGLRDPNLTIVGWPFSTVLPGIRAAQWIVTGETVKKRPEVLHKFVRALRKGAAWLNANNGKDEFYELIASYTRLKPIAVKNMHLRDISTDNDIPAMKRLAALMVEFDMTKQVVDPTPMVFETPR
jgi:NitT/TauT family transport system substrate-binding protein